MLYRQRTLDEWDALPSEQRIGIARGHGTGFGYVADEQAERYARMGEAVYAVLDEILAHPYEMLRALVRMCDLKGELEGIRLSQARDILNAVACAWEPADVKEAGRG